MERGFFTERQHSDFTDRGLLGQRTGDPSLPLGEVLPRFNSVLSYSYRADDTLGPPRTPVPRPPPLKLLCPDCTPTSFKTDLRHKQNQAPVRGESGHFLTKPFCLPTHDLLLRGQLHPAYRFALLKARRVSGTLETESGR